MRRAALRPLVAPRFSRSVVHSVGGGGSKITKWSAGDWRCALCQAQNFRGNTACFMCKAERPRELAYTKRKLSIDGAPKEKSPLEAFAPPPPTQFMAGDFKCGSCGAHNFAHLPNTRRRRTTCHKCGQPAPKIAITAGKHEH